MILLLASVLTGCTNPPATRLSPSAPAAVAGQSIAATPSPEPSLAGTASASPAAVETESAQSSPAPSVAVDAESPRPSPVPSVPPAAVPTASLPASASPPATTPAAGLRPASSKPAPAAPAQPTGITITTADEGKTLHVKLGASVGVVLTTTTGMQPWNISPPDARILASAGNPPAASGQTAQGYRAAAAGTADVTATDRPACKPGEICAQFIRAFKATVVVDPG